MEIYIVVMDVVDDVTNSCRSVNTRVIITHLSHDIIHYITAMSYDKKDVIDRQIRFTVSCETRYSVFR